MGRRFVIADIVFAISALVATTGCGQSAGAQYVSPEEVVAAAQAAKNSHDFATEVDCYSPDAQAAICKAVMGIIVATPPGQAATPEKAAFEIKYHLEQRQQQSGETQEAFADRLTSSLSDKRAFLIDYVSARATASTRSGATQPSAQLSDVQIDSSGISAKGKITRHGSSGATLSQTVQFQKIDGSWRIASLMMF